MDALNVNLSAANGAILQRLADLVDGQQVRAVVTAQTGEGAFRVRIGSLSLEVQTRVPLQTGERLELIVTRTADHLQLAIADRPGAMTTVRFARAVPELTPGASQLVTITQSAGARTAHITTTKGFIEAPLQRSPDLEPGTYLARITGSGTASGLVILESVAAEAGLLVPRGPAAESLVHYALGDRIPAVALTSSRGENHRLTVALANQTVELRASFPIEQGTRLLLEVSRLQPHIELRPVATAIPPPPGDEATRNTLLQAIPAQANLQTLMQALAELVTRQDVTPNANLPEILSRVPTLADLLDPDHLAAQLANSGSRLEANLAHADPIQQSAIAETDLKAILLRLAARWATSAQPVDVADPASAALLARIRGSLQPDDVLSSALHLHRDDIESLSSNALLALTRGATQSALARIDVLQLQHLMSNLPPPAVLAEIPVRLAGDIGSLRVLIRDQDNGPDKASSKKAWSAEIRLDLERLPDFRARVTLCDGKVSVVLHSGNEHTRRQMLTKKQRLHDQLVTRKLAVDGIRVGRTASPPRDSSSRGLLDVHA